MLPEQNSSVFFRVIPTVSQIATVYKINPAGLSTLMALSNDLADHYIIKFGDKDISKEGFSKSIAIRMLEHGIHYTVTKLDKLKTNPRSKYYYKHKLPHYSLLAGDVKAKAEGRKRRF